MSTDLDLLVLALKEMLADDLLAYHIDALSLPWDERKFEEVQSRMTGKDSTHGKLVLGVLRHDGHVRPHPPIRRALDLVTDALCARGHEVSELFKSEA